jgi:hypothetical protein
MEEEFTEAEQADILRFLGYANWASLAQSIQLGYPAAGEPLFLVLDSFKRIKPASRALIRKDLSELRCIEEQLSGARRRMRATSLEGMVMNPRESAQLRQELVFWTRRLEDDLGVVHNPFSQMGYRGLPGGLNAKVGGSS